MTIVSSVAGFVIVVIFLLIFSVLVYILVRIVVAISKIPPSGFDNPKVNNNNKGDTRERWDSNDRNPWFVNWQEGTLEDRDGNIVGDLDDRDDH